jgi:hypothetical protein
MKDGSMSIFDLNNKVKELFDNKKLIGISLKQVTSSSATIKKVEVESAKIKNIKYDINTQNK